MDFLIAEATKNLDKGNYGSAEFKATEAINVAKNLLGFEHPLVSISLSYLCVSRGLLTPLDVIPIFAGPLVDYAWHHMQRSSRTLSDAH